MAERRMFSKRIIDTDTFLDMPLSTRLLYYDLSMRADDDGFIASPRRIARMIGCTEDDIKLLIAKRFIIPFDSGVCVIKDWRVHNYIRNDRYRETQYTDEKRQLMLAKNGSYEIAPPGMSPVLPDGNQPSTVGMTCGIPQVNQPSYQRSTQDRLELELGYTPPISPPGDCGGQCQTTDCASESLKVETARGSGGKKPVDHSMTLRDEKFQAFWAAYPRKSGRQSAAGAWEKLCPDETLFSEIMDGLSRAVGCDQWTRDKGRYIPYPSTWLNQRRWEDEYPAADNEPVLKLMN